MALDTYFRGNSQEVEFCQKIRAGGNHLVACTSSGTLLGGEGGRLKLRAQELASVLAEYQKLPANKRRAPPPDDASAEPAKRPTPKPPAGGLVIRGYCTYLAADEDGKLDRATQYYYKENPDAWAAETQSDMLWLTESEWRSIVPANPREGESIHVADAIQQRFFSTIGIDYMEGSVNALPVRDSKMSIRIERVTPELIEIRLEGNGRMGKEFTENSRETAHSRGCELRVVGQLTYRRDDDRFDRFDLVGVGRAWGNKMSYTRREIRLDDYPWTYGIACHLVTGDSPIDRIPPYNLLHYNSSGRKYFE